MGEGMEKVSLRDSECEQWGEWGRRGENCNISH